MSKHLERDLDRLKHLLLDLGSKVETETDKAILALVDRRPDLAEDVRTGGAAIDYQEVEIEGECLKILALHQPVAIDLRFIVVALKVNNDLERMGDLAINIGDRAAYLAAHEPLATPLDFSRMTSCVRTMVRQSLDSLVNVDLELAREVLTMDDEVDSIHREMFHALQARMKQDREVVDRAVQLLSVSRHLERIADLATNIAEDVVFMVEGEVIRHRPEDLGHASAPAESRTEN